MSKKESIYEELKAIRELLEQMQTLLMTLAVNSTTREDK
tara:strand:- start:592 stop:708 length:117 start_codon:yes stop_codon:yes gene_type:complete